MRRGADFFLLQQNGLATEFMWRLTTGLGTGVWNMYSVSAGFLLMNPGETAESLLMQHISDKYIEELINNAAEAAEAEATGASETLAERDRPIPPPFIVTHSLEIEEYQLVPKKGDTV